MKLIKLEKLTESELSAIVASHGMVIYPTDTLYGIGCDAADSRAVQKVYDLKGRDYSKPCSVICPGLDAIDQSVKLTPEAKKLVSQLIPGPYTFVAKARMSLPFQSETIAFRIPEGRFAEIVAQLGIHFISTSANLSGQSAVSRFNELSMSLMQKADLSVDGGECKYAGPSTIIDLEKMKILRKGAYNPAHAAVLKW